jgi:hypothetical protein
MLFSNVHAKIAGTKVNPPHIWNDGGIVNTHGSIQPIAIVMVSGRFCESF